jgi:hypothetical protein
MQKQPENLSLRNNQEGNSSDHRTLTLVLVLGELLIIIMNIPSSFNTTRKSYRMIACMMRMSTCGIYWSLSGVNVDKLQYQAHKVLVRALKKCIRIVPVPFWLAGSLGCPWMTMGNWLSWSFIKGKSKVRPVDQWYYRRACQGLHGEEHDSRLGIGWTVWYIPCTTQRIFVEDANDLLRLASGFAVCGDSFFV